jgi:hypothetical protein
MNAKKADTGHTKIDAASISTKRRRSQLTKVLFPRATASFQPPLEAGATQARTL